MRKGMLLAGAVALGAVGEYAIASYFFRRTMIRTNAKRDRTQKMAGTDWDLYIPTIRAAKEWLQEQPGEEVWITSHDGLRLYGKFFPCGDSEKTVVCFHGYTSEGANDYSTLAKFYLKNGFNLLLVDQRAHGKSEGTYIGFGCLDRFDAKDWIDYVVRRQGEDCRILLHGDSMGAATVLMTAGLELPPQVKAVVSDCAFTSAWDVFSAVLKNHYHLPPFPIMQIANQMVRKRAGYELDECNARIEVGRTRLPILFIHGKEDTFVPCSMAYDLYRACQSEKQLVVVDGAGHVESCYKNPEKYEEAVRSFIFPILEREDVDENQKGM